MVFRFLDNIAIADAAFEAEAPTLNELFEECGRATFSVMIELQNVKPRLKRKVTLNSENMEMLMYDFLSELIYIKDTENFVFREFSVKIKENKRFVLNAEMKGEHIDPKSHQLGTDVKAVTMYWFSVKKTENCYKATVVLDI